jgi:uncharacterized protein with PQ loop repeat
MAVTFIGLLGLVATVWSIGILIPTIVRQYQTKKSSGIEASTLGQIFISNVLWMSYGLATGDLYVFGRSMIAEFMAVVTIVLYYKYRGN